MPYCETCGKSIPPGSDGCPACSVPAAGAADTPASPGLPADTFVWNRKVPLISNGILIRDTFLAFMGIGFAICTVLVLMTGDLDLYFMFLTVFGGLFILCLVIMFALEWRYGGGLQTMYIVGRDGVSHHAGREVQILDRGSALGSAAVLSTAGTGAGLIAASQEDNDLLWQDVKYVRVYRKLRFIELRSKFLINPVVLYCTEENFTPVLDTVKRRVPPSVNIRIHA